MRALPPPLSPVSTTGKPHLRAAATAPTQRLCECKNNPQYRPSSCCRPPAHSRFVAAGPVPGSCASTIPPSNTLSPSTSKSTGTAPPAARDSFCAASRKCGVTAANMASGATEEDSKAATPSKERSSFWCRCCCSGSGCCGVCCSLSNSKSLGGKHRATNPAAAATSRRHRRRDRSATATLAFGSAEGSCDPTEKQRQKAASIYSMGPRVVC